MPAHRSGASAAYALKTICLFPDNPTRGLDAHQGTVTLFSGETGEVRALMNAVRDHGDPHGGRLGVATQAARPRGRARARDRRRGRPGAVAHRGDARRAAVRRASASRAARPSTRRRWPRRPARRRSRASRRRCAAPTSSCTATNSQRAGARARVAEARRARERRRLEHPDGARARHGDDRGLLALRRPPRVDASTRRATTSSRSQEGAIGPDHIRAELGEILIGTHRGRTSPDELTVFKSLGLAVEDLAAAEYVVRRAEETGTGTTVEF